MFSILAEIAQDTIPQVAYDGNLSVAAWCTLVFMVVAIIGGLGWSMYRAITASSVPDEKQYSEEI